MSEQNTQTKSKGPSHHAYSVNEGKDGKGYFNKVGAAFEHKDKQGFDIQLHATPVNGRVTLRSLKAEQEAKQARAQSQGHDHGQER